MTRLLVALSLIASFISAATLARRTPPPPREYRDADVSKLLDAARAGDAEAMLWLGLKYDNGRELARDDGQAVSWYRNASDSGHASAMFLMGIRHWSGRGVAQDLAEAYKWFDLAAKYGTDEESDSSASARDSLARVMSAEMIQVARTREAEWEKDFQKRQDARD